MVPYRTFNRGVRLRHGDPPLINGGSFRDGKLSQVPDRHRVGKRRGVEFLNEDQVAIEDWLADPAKYQQLRIAAVSELCGSAVLEEG